MRPRLSTSPVPAPLTFTSDVGVYEAEAFILDEVLEKFPFPHWVAHAVALHLRLEGKLPAAYECGADFERVREAVAKGLRDAAFEAQADEIARSTTEQLMNRLIIKQYTSEVGLYPEVNSLLRLGHSGHSVGSSALAPWILQLNCAVRCLPEYFGPTYRGAVLNESEIAAYAVGKIFVWSSFVSSSKSETCCAGGNVLFEMKPGSAFILHDKRSGREIAAFSEFPHEEEVLLPICCGFRVLDVVPDGTRTRIKMEILDHY